MTLNAKQVLDLLLKPCVFLWFLHLLLMILQNVYYQRNRLYVFQTSPSENFRVNDSKWKALLRTLQTRVAIACRRFVFSQLSDVERCARVGSEEKHSPDGSGPGSAAHGDRRLEQSVARCPRARTPAALHAAQSASLRTPATHVSLHVTVDARGAPEPSGLHARDCSISEHVCSSPFEHSEHTVPAGQGRAGQGRPCAAYRAEPV